MEPVSCSTLGSGTHSLTGRPSYQSTMPTVEYLNYEVLDDHGWEMDDDDLFEKAADADLSDEDYGTLEVNPGEYILEAAEAQGYDWPFSCRAGACANCAAILREGEIQMDMQQILSDEEVEEKDVRLTCIGSAETEEVRIVYNAKHLDYLQNRVI
jgi:ferredoxin